MESNQLWRGGLPPFGCAAVVVFPAHRNDSSGSASHSDGGKPPRHSVFATPMFFRIAAHA
ncbi:hypothetical protein C9I50_14245 [Pseudomonas prosekii]|nr:hypothetical protein C9I50_14245 [Pseudomonas prosekii]